MGTTPESLVASLRAALIESLSPGGLLMPSGVSTVMTPLRVSATSGGMGTVASSAARNDRAVTPGASSVGAPGSRSQSPSQASLVSLGPQVASLRVETNNLRSDLTKANDRATKLESDLKASRNIVSSLENHLATARRQVSQQKVVIEDCNHQLDCAREAMAVKDAEMATQIASTHAQHKGMLEDLEVEIRELSREAERRQLAQFQKIIFEKDQRIRWLQEQLRTRDAKEAATLEELQGIREGVSILKTTHHTTHREDMYDNTELLVHSV